MAISYLAIQHDTAYTAQGVYDLVYPQGRESGVNGKRRFINNLIKYAGGLASGAYNAALNATVVQATAAVFASSTATITHANLTDGDTITVGGVVFTAKASGATGDQFNIGADATADAAALVAAFNASTTNNIAQFVTASNVAGVVTFTARLPGAIGNIITLATNDATAFTLSAATLVGGSTGTANGNTFSFGYGR